MLWTIKDVMEVIPLGRTRCVEIVKSLPHINTGKKLLVEPEAIRQWVKTSMVRPAAPVQRVRKARTASTGLTADGLIPKRKKTG